MYTRDFFSRFLFYSCVIHILVIGYFILDPFSSRFSRKHIQIQNAIRVDTIGLPELRRRVGPSQNLKKPNKKPAIQEKTTHSVPKAKIKKRVADKPKKPSKPDIKKRQNQAMDKIKRIKNIQNRQSQALDKLEAMESIERIKKELKQNSYTGSAISKGNSQTGETTADFNTLQYFTSVRAHINMYWSLPQELADKNFRAEIYTIINSEGAVLKGEIITSSGNEDFDARVLETIERASPLPPPPTKKIEKLLSKGVVFKFPE